MDEDERSIPILAKQIGTSQSALGYWRNGQRSPSLLAFEAACNTLGYKIALIKNSSDGIDAV